MIHGRKLADLTRCRKGENHLACAAAQAGVHFPPLRLDESVRDGPLPAQGHRPFEQRLILPPSPAAPALEYYKYPRRLPV